MSNRPLPDYANLPDSALLRIRELIPLVPFTECTVWRRVKAETFPAPVRLPEGRITAWRWGDVRQWLEEQAQYREVA